MSLSNRQIVQSRMVFKAEEEGILGVFQPTTTMNTAGFVQDGDANGILSRFSTVCRADAMISSVFCLTNTNLNHTGAYIYAKGKIMIHLSLDYKDDKDLAPGEYLRYHRVFQGLSTGGLAEKVGIASGTLTLYEKGRHPIKHSAAVALAEELGIDREKLLDEYTSFVDYPCRSLLQQIRSSLSLSQAQIADEIGVAQNSYSGWEWGARIPRRQEYEKIVAALQKRKVDVCALTYSAQQQSSI